MEVDKMNTVNERSKCKSNSEEPLKLERKGALDWNFDETRPRVWCIHGPYIEEGYNSRKNESRPFIVSSHHHHTYFGYSPREDSAKMDTLFAKVSLLDKKRDFDILVEKGLKFRDDHTVFKPRLCLAFLFNKKGWKIFQFIVKKGKISFSQLQKSFDVIGKGDLQLFLKEAILSRILKIA